MGTSVSLNGVTYVVPATGEDDWGDQVSAYLIALSTGVLSKAGGTFTLTADVNFGASYGLKSAYFSSRSTAAAAGLFRAGNNEALSWRNQANSADKALKVNTSDILEFDGNPVVTLALGAADTVLRMNGAGTAYGYGKLVNANIDDAAAIARTKLGTGTASHVLINDGSGNFSSEASLAISRGGTGQATATAGFDALSPMSALGDLIYGGAAGTRTRLAGNTTTTKKFLLQTGDGSASAAPSWSQVGLTDGVTGTLPVANGGTGQTTANAALNALLPTQTSNSGKVLKTDGTDTSWVAVASTVTTTRGDLIYRDASADARLPIGSANRILKSDGTDPGWGQIDSTSYFTSGAEVTQSAAGVVKSAGQLKGTNTNDSAATGYVGEILTSSASAVNSSGTTQMKDVTSITLSAGQWLIFGAVDLDRNSATYTTVEFVAGITTTSGNSFTGISYGDTAVRLNAGLSTSFSGLSASVPPRVVQVTGTPTYYLKGYPGAYSAGTPQFNGRITAIRVR